MEWTVVTVIVVLLGLVAAVVRPLLSLNATITRLTESVNSLQKNIAGLTAKNDESHDRLWAASAEHGQRLSNHETRLRLMEGK